MLYIAPETLRFLKARSVERIAPSPRVSIAVRREIRRPGQKLRAQFAAAIRPVLKGGEPTKFRHESTCRFALRVTMIARGFTYADADQNAFEIVAETLTAIGAKRPSWLQGQPEWRERDTSAWRYRHCMGCGGILDDTMRGRHCSRECALVTGKRHWQRENKAKAYAASAVWAAANREKRRAASAAAHERHEPRPCEHCGTDFQAPPADRFCSPRCGYDHRKAETAKRNERQCEQCGVVFVARTRARKNYFCSRECGWAAMRGAPSAFVCEPVGSEA